MKDLIIPSTTSTPEIRFEVENKNLEIKGKSLPEDTLDFYQPALDWLKDFVTKSKSEYKLTFELDYFNTATAKVFVDLLFIIKNNSENSNLAEIIWKYDEEDTDMIEVAERYESITGMPITIQPT